MITLDTTINDLAMEHGLSRRTLNVCAAAGIQTLGKLLTMSDVQLLHLRNCGHHTQRQLSALRDRYIELGTAIALESLPGANIKARESRQLEFDFDVESQPEMQVVLPQSPVLLTNLQMCYRHLFRQMSIRACNVMRDYEDFRTVLPFIERVRKPNFATFQHCGEKTVEEINKMLGAFDVLYRDELERFARLGDTPEYIQEYFRGMYPFLSESDSMLLAEHYGMQKPVPLFFLIERFIRNSQSNGAKFIREHYGLNVECKSSTLEVIAAKYNLTRERVRQILMNGLKFPSPLAELVNSKKMSFDADVYSSSDPMWDNIARENLLTNLSVRQLMALVCSINPSYVIQSITGSSFMYLVRRELLANIQVMRTFKKLRQPIDNQHTTDVEIDVMQVLRQINSGKLHRRVEAIMPIFIEPLLAIEGVESLGNGRLLSRANRYDPQEMIVNALKAIGHDSTIEQIQDEIVRQYAYSPIKNLQSLHAYILRNEHIIPIGRTGRYILDEWDNYFTGCITDYIELYLQKFDQPQSINDITNHVLIAYPHSNLSSIMTLMHYDMRKRFVAYIGGFFGLSAMQYQGDWVVNNATRSSRQFSDHFNELKTFVAEHGFFPYGSTHETGAHILQWMYNIKKHILTPTDQELKEYNDFLDQTAHLPQNYAEYRFRNVVERIRNVVEETGQLPKRATHATDLDWLRKMINGSIEYTPNQKRWWLQLRATLQAHHLI